MTILHSLHDNILGPIPTTDEADPTITKKANSAKPWLEWGIAKTLDHFRLGGSYELAMWLNMPITELIHWKNQEITYQHLLSLGPKLATPENLTQDQKRASVQNGLYLPSLTEQIEYSQKLDIMDGLIKDKSNIAAARYMDLKLFTQHELLGMYTLLKLAHDDRVNGYWPVPAMGYAGPDQTTLQNHAIIKQVSQDKWLYSHSAMKNPTADLMQHVYEARIFKHPGYKFGKY